MPFFRCRKIRLGKVEGKAEIECQDPDIAYNEAHEGLDVYKGEWAEVIHVKPKQEKAE